MSRRTRRLWKQRQQADRWYPPAEDYYVTFCALCSEPMLRSQLLAGVYWLPDMTDCEFAYARYEGFEHRHAHRHCWDVLAARRQEQIREWAFAGEEPRCAGVYV